MTVLELERERDALHLATLQRETVDLKSSVDDKERAVQHLEGALMQAGHDFEARLRQQGDERAAAAAVD